MNFGLGVIVGMCIVGFTTFIFPRNLTGVNIELVKAGMAYYDSKTGKCIWRECNATVSNME